MELDLIKPPGTNFVESAGYLPERRKASTRRISQHISSSSATSSDSLEETTSSLIKRQRYVCCDARACVYAQPVGKCCPNIAGAPGGIHATTMSTYTCTSVLTRVARMRARTCSCMAHQSDRRL